MKDLLLRNVTVVDPNGGHHGKEVDILLAKGTIAGIGKRLSAGKARVVKVEGLHVSPGWVDLGAHFREPGEEYKEGLQRGLDAAAAGGFTQVAVLPSTEPVIDSRAGVEYLLRKAAGHPVQVLPMAAISKGMKGQQLAELYDLHLAGAVAYTDDHAPVSNARLMLLALQYAANFGGIVCSFPSDATLTHGGQMHESAMSTRLGLRGLPPLAEVVQLARDLALLEYSGSRMHVNAVSTKEGVELLRAAKARGLKVTVSVVAHNLLLDDGCLRGFDTDYKVMPPLRDRAHIDALREGVKDGTIDCVISDHRPEDEEHKKLEFGQAAFGMIGLETSYAAANTALKGHMSLGRVVEHFCQGPRKVLGLPVPHIIEESVAEMTLFSPEKEWTFQASDIVSRGRNTPFIGQPFTGKVMGIVAKGQLRLTPEFQTMVGATL